MMILERWEFFDGGRGRTELGQEQDQTGQKCDKSPRLGSVFNPNDTIDVFPRLKPR